MAFTICIKIGDIAGRVDCVPATWERLTCYRGTGGLTQSASGQVAGAGRAQPT